MTAESDEIYRQLFDSLPLIAWIGAPNEASIALNDWGTRYTGIVAGNFYHEAWRKLVHPDDIARADAVWREAMASGQLLSVEYRIRRAADGEYRWNAVSVFPVKDGAGNIRQWAGTYTDIHDRKLAEVDRVILAAVVESTDTAIIGETLDGIVTSWNRAAEQIFGFAARDMIGTPISRVASSHRPAEMEQILSRVRNGESIAHFETERRRKDGTVVPIELSVCPIYEPGGQIVGAAKIVTDLSERKQAEARLLEMQSQLLHVSRLSVLGQVSSALAHEVNQPLAAVDNYIDAALLLLDSATPDVIPRIQKMLGKAALQVQRASDIIRNLRAFVRKGEMTLHPEPLDTLLRETAALAMTRAEYRRVKLRWHVDPQALWVSINRVQIQQVLVNLIRNALEAMADSPVREIDIAAAPADGFVEISVADTGPGIDPALAAELFKPFVSTKPNGVGVGLAICRSIIQAHGGQITAEGRPGGGATFRFTVARAEPQSAAAGPRLSG